MAFQNSDFWIFWDTLMSTLCPFRIFPGITCYIFVSFIIHASLLFILVSSTCGLSTEVEVGFCGCLSAAHFIRVGQTWLDSLGSAKHRFIPTFPQNGGDKKTTLKDNIGELKHCVGTWRTCNINFLCYQSYDLKFTWYAFPLKVNDHHRNVNPNV